MVFLNAFREPYKEVKTLDLNKLSIHAIRIFKYIESNSDTFRLLFNNKAFIGFQEKFSNAVEAVFLKELIYTDQLFEGINRELFVRSQSYSMMGIISYWIEHDFSYSSDFMNEQLLMIARYDATKIK
ncbi:TetR-like C-terminal domain-containing protein, partial [Neobacillus vireti]|uniref:TetR-like C-terminal domain-containing protein n=1 Tax=Neobacillus vireti TaxID=220686 RepID=UPI002FFFD97E